MSKKILIADDDASVRASLGHVLEQEGYQVIYAANGRHAVKLMAAESTDLVLLDLNMPGMDGWRSFDLMERQNPLVPVVIITARPHQHERAEGEGVDVLIEKPIDIPSLLEVVSQLLNESHHDRVARLTSASFSTRFLRPIHPAYSDPRRAAGRVSSR